MHECYKVVFSGGCNSYEVGKDRVEQIERTTEDAKPDYYEVDFENGNYVLLYDVIKAYFRPVKGG